MIWVAGGGEAHGWNRGAVQWQWQWQPEAAEEGKSSPCPNYVITFVYPRMTSSKFCEKKVPPARAFRALILPPPLVAALVEGGGRR